MQKELWPGKFPAPSGPKTKSKIDDFAKAGVAVDRGTRDDKEKREKFERVWDERIGEAPEQFRQEFVGGLKGTMQLQYREGEKDEPGELEINGKILDDDGATVATYTRTINFTDNSASSDYFKVYGTGKGVGKTMLAGNVAMYQKLGLDKVEVHANIDVGGYAWAKYGYVPSQDAWDDLRSSLGGGGGGYEPSSWDEVNDDDQSRIRDAWASSTESDFYDSEVESWRENGGDLATAKASLAGMFDPIMSRPDNKWNKWAFDAVGKATVTVGEGDNEKQVLVTSLIPADKIVNNTTVDYEDRRGDGSEDPDVSVDEKETPELTDDQRTEVEEALVEAFNKKAESDAPDTDPPEYIHDNIRDTQNEYWDSMRDRDKFKWAEENGELPESGGDGAGSEEIQELLNSDDPKAIWAIADSGEGKDLLLGTDWYGELDLHDKETMERFNAYVGHGKK